MTKTNKIQVLCVDIGTSSLKSAIIDEDGKVLAFDRQFFLAKSTNHSSSEWSESLKKSLLRFSQSSFDICAICVSGNGPTLVSQSGETLLWNADVSSLKNPTEYSGKSLYIPRILAFKEKFPSAWSASEYIFSGPEYLIWKLTGKAVSILPEKRFQVAYWSQNELLSCSLTKNECRKLPPFVSPSTYVANLTQESVNFFNAQKIGINLQTKVFCGAPDFVCALVGTNTLKNATICDRAGSSEGINFCTEKPFFAPGIRTLPSIIDGLWNESVLLGETGTKFSNFKMMIERKTRKEIDFDTLIHNCIHSDVQNKIFGQGKILLQEILQNISDGLNLLKKEFVASGGTLTSFPKKMSVSGGQARNAEWNQIKANFCEISIEIPSCKDAELVGDAVFAFTGLGKFKSIQEAADNLCKSQVTVSAHG